MKHKIPSVFHRSMIAASVLIILSFTGCATVETLYHSVPGMLPGTTRDMKTAAYWIDRHPFPDRIIMDSEEIASLNRHIIDELETRKDLAELPEHYPSSRIRERVAMFLEWFRGRTLFTERGWQVGRRFFREMEKVMALDRLPAEIPLRFGVISRYTHQRVFPTQDKIYAKRGDIDFDEMQNSALDVGTPVAVAHESADGRWYYVIDEMNEGWIEQGQVALLDRSAWDLFLNPERFVVVTAPTAAIYRDRAMTDYHEYVRTGARLPLAADITGNIAEVIIPLRDESGTPSLGRGFIRTEQVNEGYLPYTPRTIIEGAFALLNEPYGWGGMYGERDCSRFIQQVFATVGIYLPRNSSKQAQVGRLIAEFDDAAASAEKERIIVDGAVGGTSLLYMRGHIMIYLGSTAGKAFAIHDTWGYRQKTWRGDIVRVIGRVAVTDLHLGTGSRRGNYLRRIRSVRTIAADNRQ